MERPPAIAIELVQEMVLKAHSDFERVQALVAETPTLVNAVWDWGGGDFESALGGAAHMGRRDIALFLLENGARIDLPTAVMLGELEIVKAILAVFPEAHKIPGAHGIPLFVHAKAGGEQAAETLAYLQSLS